MREQDIQPGRVYAGPDPRIKLPWPHSIQHREVIDIEQCDCGPRVRFRCLGDDVTYSMQQVLRVGMTPERFAEWARADVTEQYAADERGGAA